MRVTTAAQDERLEAIGRELVHDRDEAREFRGEVREFQTDMRADMRRLLDKLDGKADRPR